MAELIDRFLDGELTDNQQRGLDLPTIRQDFLEQILTNLHGIVVATPNPRRKHLLHLLVKKVLVHDRDTIEVWYRLPQASSIRTQSDLVAEVARRGNSETIQRAHQRAVAANTR